MSELKLRDVAGNYWAGDDLNDIDGTGVYKVFLVANPCVKGAMKVFNDGYAFVTEVGVYRKIFTKAKIDAYKSANGLTHLGCPEMLGYGASRRTDGWEEEFYFIVIQRLEKLLRTEYYSMPTVCSQILDVLLFLSSQGCDHRDIAVRNIMHKDGEFYLIDYEQACALDGRQADLRPLVWLLHELVSPIDGLRRKRPAPVFGVTGVTGRWALHSVAGCAITTLYDNDNVCVGDVGHCVEGFKSYYDIGSEYCDYSLTSGTTNKSEHFFITPPYNNAAIPKRYIRDISTKVFIKLVMAGLVGLEHLSEHELCHNNVCPDALRFSPDADQFYLVSLDKVSKLNSPTFLSFEEPGVYAGMDTYTLGPSLRNDLCSLIFCMLYWAGIPIPWTHIKDPKQMYEMKRKFIDRPDELLTACTSSHKCKLIEGVMEVYKRNDMHEVPDYVAIEALLDATWCSTKPREHTTGCRDIANKSCDCMMLETVKEELILGLPAEINKSAMGALKYVNIW